MRQLICEMCGSADMLKQDGVFICQACKTKYSIEEAKKMMMNDDAKNLPVAEKAPVQMAENNRSTPMLSNLLQLAQNSYDAKNYEQAENFCNQALTMDGSSYVAWKLKGQAIDAQITVSKDRIDEASQCFLTAYKVLDDSGKNEHREELTAALRGCLESQIDFALNVFRQERPTEAVIQNVLNTFSNCFDALEKGYIVLGHTADAAQRCTLALKNIYLPKVNEVCKSSWHNKVYYNYYRHGWTKEYHPTRDIMEEFISECSALSVLLEQIATYFSDDIRPVVKAENYRLRKLIASTVVNAQSFKLMEYTTTNEYGAVINKRTQWENDCSLSDSSKAFWNQIADQADVEITKTDPNEKDRMIKQWEYQKKSISTTFSPHIGWLIGTVFAGVLAFITFTYLPDLLPKRYDFIFTIFGLFFAGIAVIALAFSLIRGKATYDQNLEQIARLDRKIRQASDNSSPSGVSGIAQPAKPISVTSGVVPADKWACKHCGTLNSKNYGQCKKCGTYKS